MINRPIISICWLRRDLRIDDHAALYHALRNAVPILPLFIFDTDILDKLTDKSDRRVQFIQQELVHLQQQFAAMGTSLLVRVGKPVEVWRQLLTEFDIKAVYINHDYEPYAIQRDTSIADLIKEGGGDLFTFKDIVIFEKAEVVKEDGTPYTVFTPYSRKWKTQLKSFYYKPYPCQKYYSQFYKVAEQFEIPTLNAIGFRAVDIPFPARVVKSDIIEKYSAQRDFPAIAGTSRLGLHLRFGTLSVRQLLAYALRKNETFVNELIWRDFYQQILWHFPQVVSVAFKRQYDFIEWENDPIHFQAWCEGRTGYPLVDAGMRELNATGYMHNRVRMVAASFLTKHLLIDWRWGEAYFAQKLLDFDLAANNGGWQWAAGCGTDAAPYFRIFNPTAQLERFDPAAEYVKQWVPKFGTPQYETPIVDHEKARVRCLDRYKQALKRE